MKIKFLRSTSLGLSGTLHNADHHAKPLLPLVTALGIKASKWNFDTWFQAHNVHVFRTKDGRNVILRPFGNKGYEGIKAEVSLSTRCANHNGILLATLYADNRNNVTVDDFSKIMQTFASCSIEDVQGKVQTDTAPEEEQDDLKEEQEKQEEK
jgi:hypothetical protein